MTIENVVVAWEPQVDFPRFMLWNTFGGFSVEDDDGSPSEEAAAFVDPRALPDWIAHPEAIRDLFARYAEVERTIKEGLALMASEVTCASLLLLVEAKFIVLIKCVIGVYNHFHVQDADETRARYSTLLSDDPRNDLALMLVMMDTCLGMGDARSPEARHVRERIDDAAKMLFDMLTGIAGDKVRGSGIRELREQYRSFHVPHVGVPIGFKPTLDLLAAFARVADFFAEQEGRWARERPTPTLRKPAFGTKIRNPIPNKLVADAFGVKSQNTVINWNKGHTKRPFDYQGPYPDTPEGNEQMKADGELHKAHKHNRKIWMNRTPEEIEALLRILPPRYKLFKWGPEPHGKGNRIAKTSVYQKGDPNWRIDYHE